MGYDSQGSGYKRPISKKGKWQKKIICWKATQNLYNKLSFFAISLFLHCLFFFFFPFSFYPLFFFLSYLQNGHEIIQGTLNNPGSTSGQFWRKKIKKVYFALNRKPAVFLLSGQATIIFPIFRICIFAVAEWRHHWSNAGRANCR